jgi:hypothetical protein
MSQNVTKFRWGQRQAEVANLLAEDALTDEAIAGKVGISRRQMARWKTHPEFRARVEAIVEELGDTARRRAIGRRTRRVAALDRRWQDLRRVIEERAADPAAQNIPGGSTGLLVRRSRVLGHGAQCHTIEQWELDVGLLRELRSHERQAAQELGQWGAKTAPPHPGGTDESSTGGFTEAEILTILEGVTARLGLGVGEGDSTV